MQIISSLKNLSLSPSVATIGFFDGVHLGHHHIIQQVIKEAKKGGLKSTVITFADHPSTIIHERKMELLTPIEEKLQRLDKEGIDQCVVLPFTERFAKLSAYEFMSQILKKSLNINSLYIGYDNRFGHRQDKVEGFKEYVSYGKEIGIKVLSTDAVFLQKEEISSSLIREMLKEKNLTLANSLLGYIYSIDGVVVDGKKIGRLLGFPTANIKPTHKNKLIPAKGVYIVSVLLDDILHKGMLSIGCRPTLKNGKDISIEVNILDFNECIYGKQLKLKFHSYLREEIAFENKEALIEQLKVDEVDTRHYFNTHTI